MATPQLRRSADTDTVATAADTTPLPLAASSLGRRAVFAAAAAAFVAAAAPAAPVVAADLLTDYATDTKDLILRQRGLLREGKGDVDAYMAKADAFFAGYKWDHAGHTNSFSQLMSVDIVIRGQNDYLVSTGAKWSPETVPATGTPKARMLEGYLQNADRCIIKEAFPKFGAMDPSQRATWKALSCTQGLVAPA